MSPAFVLRHLRMLLRAVVARAADEIGDHLRRPGLRDYYNGTWGDVRLGM